MAINLVNWAETLTVAVRRGQTVAGVRERLRDTGVLGPNGLLSVVPITEEDATRCAELYALTAQRRLSLGDRMCLATGLRLGLPVLTTDRTWSELRIEGLLIRTAR